MRKYELSISADYVPEWGVVEAIREYFQNAIDEETRDSSNKMTFDYDASKQTIRIGNKHSDLGIQSLLFGSTTKRNDSNMIGNHGEGYKIATVVLLREGYKVTFYNYCHKEIWRPKLVQSRRYGGLQIPTFFVEDIPVWKEPTEHALSIEIEGITPEDYEAIVEANLHLQNVGDVPETRYGALLKDEKYRGKVFVGGLYICTDARLEVGVNFKPRTVRIERDRNLVSSFDVQWYVGQIIAQLKDKELTKNSIGHYYGAYLPSYAITTELADELATEFINEYGAKAVPISDQNDLDAMKKRGYKPVIVPAVKKDAILESTVYTDIKEVLAKEKEKAKPLYDRFCAFAEAIEKRLTDDQVVELYEFVDEISNLGNPEE